MHLLALPYELRSEIYRHAFPPGQQIYLQAHSKTLSAITQEHRIPTGLLLTCRALNTEICEHLYNGYLFNIVGKKIDCLSTYEPFEITLRKHARDLVHVDAFSNGSHSSTMCISLQAGEARMTMLKERERGEPTTILEMRKEVGMPEASASRLSTRVISQIRQRPHLLAAAICAIVAILVALVM